MNPVIINKIRERHFMQTIVKQVGVMRGAEVRRACIFVLLGTLALSSSAQRVAVQGQASVGSDGALKFVIPLMGPVGTAGMDPKLALVYDSNSGQGNLGLGWSLGGLPVVERCAKTVRQDGIRSKISWGANDGICLNGKRLILASGTYGMDGSEYRTELEEFSKIVLNGTFQAGFNSTIKVWTKDGRIMEFGNRNNYYSLWVGYAAPVVWPLNRVSDSAGNYYEVGYDTRQVATGSMASIVPVRIDFTANDTPNKNGDTLVPKTSIQFVSSQGDWSKYQTGMAIRNPSIDSINYYIGTSLIKAYRLTYSCAGGCENRTLTAVEETATGTLAPLPPIKFQWQPAPSWNLVQSTASNAAFPGALPDYQHYFVDLDGSGKKAWIQISKGTDEAWIGRAYPDGHFDANSWSRFAPGVGRLNDYEFYFADIDGDGKVDLIRVSRTSGQGWVARGLGDGTFDLWTRSTNAVGSANEFAHYFADVDGDGRADWIQVSRTLNDSSVALALGGGDFQFWTNHSSYRYGLNAASNYFADLDGDGKADWIQVAQISSSLGNIGTPEAPVYAQTDGTYGLVYPSDGSGQFSSRRAFKTSFELNGPHFFIDVNGDGNADMVQITPAYQSGNWMRWIKTSLSDGAFGFVATGNVGDYIVGEVYPGDDFQDFTGDGRVDRICVPPENSSHYAFIARGSGDLGANTAYRNKIDATLLGPENYQHFFADLNGDGALEWIQVNRATSRATVLLGTGVPSQRIVGISNDVGMNISIAYKPLSDSTVYTRDNDAVYPITDAVYPLRNGQMAPYVVAQLTTPTGTGGTLNTAYTYGGRKVDQLGRGSLGFRWIRSTQLESGISTYTTYRQDWPFTGLPVSSIVTTSAGAQLKLTSYSYDCNDFVSSSGCVPAIGRRYFPYLSQSTVNSWDLSGAVLPTMTSTMQYDSFGNATHVVNSTSDGFIKTTDSVFSNDPSKWWIGRPTRVTVTNSMQ